MLHFWIFVFPLIVAYSGPSRTSTPKVVPEESVQTQTVPHSRLLAAAVAHADFLRRRDCPVPCGYYNQLCCNANEICYTDPSLQAQCSATASPFPASQTTITTTNEATVTYTQSRSGSTVFQVSTFETTHATTEIVTFKTTASVTLPPTTATLTAVSTEISATTATAVSTYSPESSATAIGMPLTEEHANHGWPRWKKIVVGVLAPVAAVLAVALFVWLLLRCRRRINDRREDRSNTSDFNAMEQGGTRPRNTARMQDATLQSLSRSASAAQYYIPPQPRPLRDASTSEYAIVEDPQAEVWPPKAVDPPSYHASEVDDERSVSPIHTHSAMPSRTDHGHRPRSAPLSGVSVLDRPYNSIPMPGASSRRSQPSLRRPVPRRQPTVETLHEMQGN